MELRKGPSPLSRCDELYIQQGQLYSRRKLDAANDTLYKKRSDEIFGRRMDAHRWQPPPRHDTVLPSFLGQIAQASITALVHPAVMGLPSRTAAIGQSQNFIAHGLQAGWAKRTTFWARDDGAALLDGLWVAKATAHERRDKPHLVLVVGPHRTYESMVPQAKVMADCHDVVVVLHNSRGVGRSVGRQMTLEQAVEDCKAVIRHLQREGHKHIALYGVGLGSSLAFRALQQLGATGEIGPSDIGLAAAIRAPTSLPHIVGAHVGRHGAALCVWLLHKANLPDLDMTRTLAAPLAAAHLLLMGAPTTRAGQQQDELVHALRLAQGEQQLPSGQRATVLWQHEPPTAAHDAVIRSWAERARAHRRAAN